MGDLSNKQKQELAETMFINDLLAAEQIAEKLEVTKRTVFRWMEAGDWKSQRDLLKSAPHKVKQFIDQKMLEAMEGKPFDPKLADFLSKTAKVREQLEQSVSVHTVISVFTEFDKFMLSMDPLKAKEFTKYHKLFIYSKAK